MYTYEDRVRAVKLYIQYDCSAASVINELGYPEDSKTIKAWYLEFKEYGDLHRAYAPEPKYSDEMKNNAVAHFFEHGKCISRTVRALGYINSKGSFYYTPYNDIDMLCSN